MDLAHLGEAGRISSRIVLLNNALGELRTKSSRAYSFNDQSGQYTLAKIESMLIACHSDGRRITLDNKIFDSRKVVKFLCKLIEKEVKELERKASKL